MRNMEQTQPFTVVFGKSRIRRVSRQDGRRFFDRVLSVLLGWQERSTTRRQLLNMSDHMLQDIGLTRAQMAREANKPFWEN